jgi:hypothetical protein
MSRTKLSKSFPVAAAMAMALSTVSAAGQSYGTNDQVLTIGAGSLRDRNGFPGALHLDGYIYPSGAGDLLAPLPLPAGAELRQLCLYVNDHTSGVAAEAAIVAVKLVPGAGGNPQVATVPNSLVSSTSDIGYGYYCTGNIGYTLQNGTDVDGDGSPDNVVYYARVSGGGSDPIGIGAVWLIWGRQVTPAPVSPTFSDVPASDGAFAFVEALASSGITSGCGGGHYCPDATLTRRQMAVFLAKALGLHWPS